MKASDSIAESSGLGACSNPGLHFAKNAVYTREVPQIKVGQRLIPGRNPGPVEQERADLFDT